MTEAANQPKVDDLSFEDAMRQLDQIVRQLESGQVDLEQSISIYEQGMRLKAHCEHKLKAAEARIEKVTTDTQGQIKGTEPANLESGS